MNPTGRRWLALPVRSFLASTLPFVFLLWILPIAPAIAQEIGQHQVASAAKLPAGVIERDVTFPTDGLMAPGTLTLPAPGKSEAKPPVAVLVGGSGIQDRDETVGPNKFLRQLAWGLAERGIASLRYDRRAKFDLASFMAHPDLDHEVVIDAANALGYVQTLPEVDGRAVFLIGHSLGAQLAPDIVAMRLKQAPGSVRGMVLLSGIARPIDVVIDGQIRTLGAAQGGTPAQVGRIADAWDQVFLDAKNPATPNDKLLGIGQKLPAGYWRDWLRRNPVATMQTMDVPAFVTRGMKDVNSTHEDFELLSHAHDATGREFPGLNHLYMPIAGQANGRDVMTPGTVSPVFLDAVAGWIKRTR